MRRFDSRLIALVCATAAVHTNARGQADPAVVPVSLVGTSPAPIARFADLTTRPRDVVDAVYSMRAGADWLARMNQSNGRFFPGVNPVDNAVAADDLRPQLEATVALATAARFTGEEAFAVRATQSVLTFRAMTAVRPDNPNLRVPTVPADSCPPVVFAALLSRAIDELPNADASLKADADKLCGFVLAGQQADGSFAAAGDTGVLLHAVAASHTARPDPKKRDGLSRGLSAAQTRFRAEPDAVFAATVLPAATTFYMSEKDAGAATVAFEMADWLCDRQYTPTDAPRVGWAGGFRPTTGPTPAGFEPGADAAVIAAGLAAATKLTRHAPDVTRHARYHRAAAAGLEFARRLQYTRESTTRYDPQFGRQFLVGGMCRVPSDPTARPGPTAELTTAHLAYLESAAETGGR